MSTLWQDIRYSLRMIAKAPGYAAVAILTLGLGIGANTTIFSWISATLLNPIPGLTDPNAVVSLSLGRGSDNPFPMTYPDLVAIRDGQQSFTGIMGCGFTPLSLTGKGKPERIWGSVVTANYFDVLGVRPILGRTFLPAEDEKPGGAPVAVVSYRFWQTHLGANPDVIGQTIELNQRPFTVVGVAPAVFQGSQTGIRNELWVPMSMVADVMPRGDLLHDHHYFWIAVFGRLKSGVKPEQAQEEMTVLLKHEVKNFPEEHRGHDVISVTPLWRSPFGANMFFSLLLPMLMSIAGLVLLLACANVANLMLVRSVARRRELAIRMSLGASRWRLVRQLLIESVVLAIAGGVLAFVITFWTSGTFMKFVPAGDFPFSLPIGADRTVLLATFLISVLTGVIFGTLPALRSSGDAPVNVLKEDSGSASGGLRKARLTSGLVVAQIALSLLLLICAGLFIRSFQNAQQINPGFNPHNIFVASFDLFTAGYSDEKGAEFDRLLTSRLEALPGVQSVALTTRIPLGFGGGSSALKIEGYVPQQNESMETQVGMITPNYFQTVQLPLVQGRDFTLQDDMKAQRVAIVNETFVNRYWPGQVGLGKQVNSDLTHEWFTVVGIARDSKVNQPNEKPTPFIYLPQYQVYRPTLTVLARTTGDPLAEGRSIERAIHDLNSDLVIYDVTTLESREEIASFPQRIAGTFVGAFGLLALVLAAVGIYGVTSYTTRQRTHEIGIRMALGASKQDVLRMVLSRGMFLTALGILIGLAAAFGLTRFLSSQLMGVTSTDALTFSGVALLLVAVALVACLIPALRAMRVDPLVALRYE
ncbi:MAG TPA: ABC transporter permease [Candidatus Sulfotelmatobacter sp.]|nr:ABC transporter permease [Candidatus Sulfotelmatobacter sp.]